MKKKSLEKKFMPGFVLSIFRSATVDVAARPWDIRESCQKNIFPHWAMNLKIFHKCPFDTVIWHIVSYWLLIVTKNSRDFLLRQLSSNILSNKNIKWCFQLSLLLQKYQKGQNQGLLNLSKASQNELIQ